MSSRTRVRLVSCPECRTLLLPAYRCANCNAILKDADDSSPETIHKKSSKDSATGSPYSLKDAASLRKGTHFSSGASVSGSELGIDEIEYEEADQDRIESTEDAVSSSRYQYDNVSCKSYGEPSELGRDSDWIYEGEDTLSEISSIALDEDDESQCVKKERSLRWSTTSQGNDSDNAIFGTQLRQYKKEGLYQNQSGNSGPKGPVQYDSSYAKFTVQQTEDLKASMTRTQTASRSGLPSTGNEYKKLVTKQRLPVSRRTFRRPIQPPSQQHDVKHSQRGLVDDNSTPCLPKTPVKSAVCSETITNEKQMANYGSKFEDGKCSPKMPMEVKQNQSKDLEERVMPIYASPVIHEDSEEYYNQRASERHNRSKSSLEIPPSSVGVCAADRIPPRCIGLVHSTEGHKQGGPSPLDHHEREVVIRTLDELKGYLTRIPVGGSVTQSGDADSSTLSSQGLSSHSINKNGHVGRSPHGDFMKPNAGLCAPTGSGPEACDSSQISNLQQPRNRGSGFGPYARSNFEIDGENAKSLCVEGSSPSHCYDNCQRPSQPPSCICSNQGFCRACTGRSHDHAYGSSNVCQPPGVKSSLNYQNPSRSVAICHPMLGGAPFLMCLDCSKFLKLPTGFVLSKGRVNKVRCGNCKEILKFDVSNGHIRIQKQNLLPDETHNRSEDTGSKAFATRDEQGSSNREPISAIGDEFQSEPVSFSHEYGASFSRSDCSSNSGSNSLQVPFATLQANVSGQRDSVTNRRGEGAKRSGASSVRSKQGSPLISNLHYFSESELLERNHSGNSLSENDAIGKDLRRNEMEYILSTDSERGKSSEFGNENDHGRQPKNSSKASSVAGFMKKGIANIGLDSTKRGVFVNGRPIPDRLVKKAEERAGPIDPGHYWYDYHAGFWGVMGKPCHGIIRPYIEEFNIPMPRNCSRGRTGVIVNGRELHQEDLDMLTEKGLPTVENREYVINISGQVVDTATHQRFNLGNLAPTVEMTGRGFGMLVPRSLD